MSLLWGVTKLHLNIYSITGIFCYIRLHHYFIWLLKKSSKITVLKKKNTVPIYDTIETEKDAFLDPKMPMRFFGKLDFKPSKTIQTYQDLYPGRRPISNKIPSPKERVYPDTLFYYLQCLCGFRDFWSYFFTSKMVYINKNIMFTDTNY